ncbi:MAG: UDP-N-acetylmuramoyl-L-alanine--D-glutamate ligase [Candidatus Fimenecus sp.]
MYPPIAEYFRDKSVLLVGFGREGQSTFRYIRTYFPEMPLTIADKNEIAPPDAFTACLCGDDYLQHINEFSLVMKSPGISFKEVEVGEYTEVTCQVDLFLRFANCHKIGITGSKGKTTTSTLTYQMLKAAGKDCRLIGNIGVPVFEALDGLTPDTVAVIEMSSHQLEFTHCSPEVAVLTNLYEEHLEHYKGGFSGYVQAKSHIALYQKSGDLFLYNGTQGLAKFVDLSAVPSEKIGICADAPLPFAVENEHLAGVHNYQDILFARAAAKRFGATDADCETAVREFQGIAHRMEQVGTFHGITFYNDCIATIPHAVLCAVEALKTVDTLIIGGKDRGLDYSGFVEDLKNSSIRNILGTPETGHAIVDALKAAGATQNCIAAADLDEAVRLAYRYTAAGKICLLSPAASSYNVYKNFEEKGKHYKMLVKAYGQS